MTVPAQTPNIGLNFGWETGDDDWGGPVNWNWLLLDVVSVPFAKSITLTVPPTSPEEGDRYIIPAGATGVWANKTGRIAYFASGQWLYFQPKKGWYQRVFDTHKTYVWNGVEWEHYLDSITPEMMAQINAAVAAGEDAVEAAASTAADRAAVHEDRLAVDAARQAVDTAAAQVSSDKTATVSAKNTAVAAASDAAASKQSASESAVITVQKAQEAAASAGSASTSAGNASASAGQAVTARDAAVTAKVDLFNRYYGPLSADPATRPDGNPVQAGDEYTNTTTGKRRYYNGAAWDNLTGVASADLAAVDGASLVGAATYAQLRAYTGSATKLDLLDGGKVIRTGTDADNGGTVFKDGLNRSWERVINDGTVHLDWFLPEDYDPNTMSCNNAANAAWLFCVARKFNLYHGPRRYRIIGESSFPYGRTNGLAPSSLTNYGGIKIYGAGQATILETDSIDGADVIQLNGADNLEVCHFTVRSYITGTAAGSNGVSVTGGFDRLLIHDIWPTNLAFVDKTTYIDGGKSLSIQTPVSGQTVKCGTLKAWNIFAKGCVYGAGIELDLVAASAMPTSIEIEVVADSCREAVVVSAGEATSALSGDWQSGIKIKAVAINCMSDVILSRAHGVDIDCTVVTTKTDAERLLSPTGSKWKATDTVADVVGLKCAYAHDSKISIHGNKGYCSYKALIGGSTAGYSGLSGETQGCKINVDLSGTASVTDVGAIDSGGNVTSQCVISTSGDTSAPAAEHYAPSRGNLIISGNTQMLNDLLIQGALKFTYSDGKTVYAEIGYDDESVTVKQTLGSSANLRPFRVLKNDGATVMAVRNDGGLCFSLESANSVSGALKVLPIYNASSGAFEGYAPVYTTKT